MSPLLVAAGVIWDQQCKTFLAIADKYWAILARSWCVVKSHPDESSTGADLLRIIFNSARLIKCLIDTSKSRHQIWQSKLTAFSIISWANWHSFQLIESTGTWIHDFFCLHGKKSRWRTRDASPSSGPLATTSSRLSGWTPNAGGSLKSAPHNPGEQEIDLV